VLKYLVNKPSSTEGYIVHKIVETDEKILFPELSLELSA
jgi:hypothetical protein